jgi:hypothetical protein
MIYDVLSSYCHKTRRKKMTNRLRSMEISSIVQKIYQERLPSKVTAVQTAVTLVRKEFADSRKLKYHEVVIGLGLSDLAKIRGQSYRLYLDPTGAEKHRLYGFCGYVVLAIHLINEDKLQALEEYRRGMREEKENRKRQKTNDEL